MLEAELLELELFFHCNSPRASVELAGRLTANLQTAKADWKRARAAHDAEGEARAADEWQYAAARLAVAHDGLAALRRRCSPYADLPKPIILVESSSG